MFGHLIGTKNTATSATDNAKKITVESILTMSETEMAEVLPTLSKNENLALQAKLEAEMKKDEETPSKLANEMSNIIERNFSPIEQAFNIVGQQNLNEASKVLASAYLQDQTALTKVTKEDLKIKSDSLFNEFIATTKKQTEYSLRLAKHNVALNVLTGKPINDVERIVNMFSRLGMSGR